MPGTCEPALALFRGTRSGFALKTPLTLLTTVLASLLLACGSSGPEPIALEPDAPSVQVGERLQLRATPQEDLAAEPEWEITEYNGGGLLATKGLNTTYLAPNHAGTFHLVLRAKRPDGSPIKIQRELRVRPLFQPEPASAVLHPGQSQTFTVKVKGLVRSDVIWKAEAGSIGASGTYTAPEQPGTYRLTATSAVDPTVTATVTVLVN